MTRRGTRDVVYVATAAASGDGGGGRVFLLDAHALYVATGAHNCINRTTQQQLLRSPCNRQATPA